MSKKRSSYGSGFGNNGCINPNCSVVIKTNIALAAHLKHSPFCFEIAGAYVYDSMQKNSQQNHAESRKRQKMDSLVDSSELKSASNAEAVINFDNEWDTDSEIETKFAADADMDDTEEEEQGQITNENEQEYEDEDESDDESENETINKYGDQPESDENGSVELSDAEDDDDDATVEIEPDEDGQENNDQVENQGNDPNNNQNNDANAFKERYLESIKERDSLVHNMSSNIFNDFCYTMEDKHEIYLLDILNKYGAPFELFQAIIEWAKDAASDKYDFQPKRKKRKSQINHLQKWLGLQFIEPEVVTCLLPSDHMTFWKSVKVTRFPFTTMLLSLLKDPRLVSNIENFDLNSNDPFSKYESPGGFITTANSGVWYERAYNHCVKEPDDFLCPIIFAIDESKLSQGGKQGCCPVMFTTSIFNQSMRNLPHVWRPLGYVFDMAAIESKSERERQDHDLKYGRMHAIYHTVLETFIEAQRGTILNQISLTLGGITKTVNIKVPCFFIIGDIVGGDKICCTSPSYKTTLKRICRKCNIPGKKVGDPDYKCKRMSMEKIKKLVENNETKRLASINQFNVYSAFFHLCYGGCRFGCFSAASPIESLHSLDNGLCLDCLTQLFKRELRGKGEYRAQLDNLCKVMCLIDRQFYLSSGARKEMPALLWKNGITSITNTKAHEKIGIMLVVVVLSLTEEGKELFNEAPQFKRHPDKLKKLQYTFQQLLCYRMWLAQKQFWKRGDKQAREDARGKIRTMLKNIKSLWPREKGSGWNKPKYHEQLHVVDDIERNGAPQSTHTGRTESHHIEFVKKLAKRTQRRSEKLDYQIGQRYKESYIIQTAKAAIDCAIKQSTEEKEIIRNGDTIQKPFDKKGELHIFLKDDGSISYAVFDKKKNTIDDTDQTFQFVTQQLVENDTLKWWQFDETTKETTINFYSEYHRNEDLFRSNDNYQGSKWHDWVMIRWKEDNPKSLQPNLKNDAYVWHGDSKYAYRNYCYTPSKIVGPFFQIPTINGSFDYFALVWPSKYNYKLHSIFTTRWEMQFNDLDKQQQGRELANCDAFVRHCCMIPEQLTNENRSQFYQEIWPRELWASKF